MRLGVVQMSMAQGWEENVPKAERLVEQAVAQGAQLVLLPELFAGPYFCQTQREQFWSWAHPVEGHPWLGRFADLAARLKVYLPISFFERDNNHYYNSLIWFDAQGQSQGVYRKSHIPDGPGYQEKFYFRPGNSGFRTWNTPWGRVGVGICWDQWFPEAARCMALQGADLLLYPTAIGSEPPETSELDTSQMWLRAQLGHAVSNSCYVAGANRVGVEGEASFYGHSYIADARGEFLAHQPDTQETVLLADLDFQAVREFRASMGFFRDRRPELYSAISTPQL